MPGMVRYGIDFNDPEHFGDMAGGFSDAMVEMYMMLHKIGPKDGGLGEHAHLKNAMMLLWPNVYGGEVAHGVPRWRDEIELLTWAWCEYNLMAVIGHASAGKTHTFGHVGALGYIADSMNTILTLTSTHLPGLRKRLWADTVAAIRSAQIGEGVVGGDYFSVRSHDMSIRPNDGLNADKYIIEGIATDKGQEAVEKIQGNHSRKRRHVVIDEAQGTPGAIFEASANLMTDPDFRMAMLANPTKRYSEFGTWCEPNDGWSAIDPETDVHWETRRGGVCIRLDGLKSPNIRHNAVHFPFLIRPEYLDSIRKSFGEGSPRWWTFVRGWFAPEGLAGVVVPQSVIQKAEAAINYDMPPVRIASLDPAFEGGDQCVLMIGEYGKSGDTDHALNIRSSQPLKLKVSENSDPLDYLIAHEVMRICKNEDIEPENFILDTTGAGRGVAAILAKEWGPVQRCGFGEKCSERQVRASEPEPAKDLFDRFVSELWWAIRVWMEEGMVGGVDSAHKNLRQQLVARQYETVRDKKISIEPKKEMKNRLGYSPDEADTLALLIELVRRRGGVAGTPNTNKNSAATKHNDLAVSQSRMFGAEAEYA
jgi:hypothetical protein